MVPPAKIVSLGSAGFWASSMPVNVQPFVSLVAWRYGAVPVQLVGVKSFQSKVESMTRFASLPSKLAAVDWPAADTSVAPTARPSVTKTARSTSASWRGVFLCVGSSV